MASTTATIEVLAAEVHVLQVGSRQVTLSVYRQLDEVEPHELEPFGRVRDRGQEWERGVAYVVGRDLESGALVRSSEHSNLVPEWEALPLIVLAGLR